MLRWRNWANRRSRRQKSVRTRILRIDELENRRLLYNTFLGGSLEESVQHDECECEYRFEMDDDAQRAVILGSAAVVDSHDAEGENDGWEDEAHAWTYVVPAAPIGSTQVPAGYPDSSDNLDNSTTQKPEVSPGTSLPTTATAPPASEIGKSAGSGKDLAEGESSASEAKVQTDGDSLQSSGGDQPVASSSPGQIGIPNLAAETANPRDGKTAANLVEDDAVSPTARSARITAGDGRIASGSEETPSLAANQTKADGSSEAFEMPIPTLDRPQRHPMTAAERLSRHTLRPMKTPPGSPPDGRDQIFAAMAAESNGTGNWRLRESLSQDLAALETALQDLLADSSEMGRDMADWFLSGDVIHWTLAATIALIAAEIIRRKTQRSRASEHPTPYDGADISLRLFPELVGLPPGARP